ncbi:MAG: DUF4160 domain-containing protein [Prevotella sp.]|jgi:hypothetical protein|nr:DUF4160 domain-containing protein [Prevotella sp.]
MSPVIKRVDGFAFSFFMNEEDKPHIHVFKSGKRAKFWLNPVELVYNRGFKHSELRTIYYLVKAYEKEFEKEYNRLIRNCY